MASVVIYPLWFLILVIYLFSSVSHSTSYRSQSFETFSFWIHLSCFTVFHFIDFCCLYYFFPSACFGLTLLFFTLMWKLRSHSYFPFSTALCGSHIFSDRKSLVGCWGMPVAQEMDILSDGKWGKKTGLLWRLHSCESWWHLQAATVPQSPHVASTIHPHDLKHILSHPTPDCLLSSTLADWLGVSTWLAVWDVPPYLWKGSYNLCTVYHFKWTALHFWHTAVYSHKRGIENISIYPPNHPYVPLQSTPSFIPRQPLIFCPHSFAFSGMSYKWNHRVCSLLCLYVVFHLA